VTMGEGTRLDADAFLMKGEVTPAGSRWRGKAILHHIRMLIRADVEQTQAKRRLLMISQLQRAKNELARRDPRYMRKLLLIEKLKRHEARQCR
jgi:hypothetical protein